MGTAAHAFAVCRAKWLSGATFRTKRFAKAAASRDRRRTGEDIRAYRCSCGYYHVGHHLTPEQLRERARARARA